MRTPYVPHLFGQAAWDSANKKQGWLIAAVATSIPWPQEDVLVTYDGVEYLLLSAVQDQKPASPCVATPCPRQDHDVALAQVLRFVSILGWFKRGFVDVAGFIWGNRPYRYGDQRLSYADVLQGGQHGFECNYMPIIEDDEVRKALAFWREGKRLRRVHDAYAFLSFFKVIESQFDAGRRTAWIEANLPLLDGDAAKRVAELQADGINVNEHIYVSGRCAVAHASAGRQIVDPDIPSDRRRIRDDLVLAEALATRFLAEDAGVPDEMVLYSNRDRMVPWHSLLAPKGLARLLSGQAIESGHLDQLAGAKVSVRIWPHEPSREFVDMRLDATESGPGWVKFVAVNQRETILLVFQMDFANGRMHALLDEWALAAAADPTLTEADVESFAYLFHSMVGNALVELMIEGSDPVACEIIVPVNIIPRAPKQAAAEAVEQFRMQRGGEVKAKSQR